MRPPHRHPRARRRLTALAVVLALTLVGCSTSGSGGPGAATEEDERVATVLALREEVGPPAAQLGTAAATVTQQLADLRAELPVDPVDRLAAAAGIRDGALTDLEGARAAVGSDLVGDAGGPEAEAVREALAEATTAAEALADAVARDLAQLERIAHADERLVEVVAAWEEPGSRSQQLARLGEAATAVDDLGAELDGSTDEPGCLTAIGRRGQDARELAERTAELRGLVEGRRGEEFDARRREFGNAPAASTLARVEADRAEVGCWREQGDVIDRAAAVADALERLEAGLNPSDLASSDRG